MSITNENTENVFPGNGLTTIFPTNISAFSAEQVLVYIREDSIDTLQTLSTHYTLSGFKPVGSNDEADGAVTVTMLVAPTADQQVVVVRATDKTQDLALTSSRAYNPEVLMQQLDLIVMMVQEIAKSQARTFKVKPGIDVPTELDNPAALADALDIIAAVLSGTGWQVEDPKLNAIVNATWAANKLLYLTGVNTVGVTDITSYGRTVLGLANAAALLADIGGQAAASILSAISGLSATGLISRTGDGTVASRLITSPDGSVAITNPGGVAGDVQLSVGATYVSAEFTPVREDRRTLAHGLPAAPTDIRLILRCQTAEHGFSVNDTIVVHPGSYDPSSAQAVQAAADGTNIFYANYWLFVRHKTTGTGSGAWFEITYANWRARIVARV